MRIAGKSGGSRWGGSNLKKSLFLCGTDTIGWMNDTNQEVGLKADGS
jgi:hypothetical protein